MSVEINKQVGEPLVKTINIDRAIRTVACCTCAVSLAAVCYEPLTLGTTALVSAGVYYVADHQLKHNLKKSAVKFYGRETKHT